MSLEATRAARRQASIPKEGGGHGRVRCDRRSREQTKETTRRRSSGVPRVGVEGEEGDEEAVTREGEL